MDKDGKPDWVAYLPPFIAQSEAGKDFEGQREAVVLVVLFAALQKIDPETELYLTRLNAQIESIISFINQSGGIVAELDSRRLCAFFPHGLTDRASVFHRAAQCAFNIRSQTALTAAGEVKMGLAAGSIHWFSVGDPAIQLKAVLAGDAVDSARNAAKAGGAGDIIIPDGDFTYLADRLQILAHTGGYSRITALLKPAEMLPVQALPTPPADSLPLLAAYIPQTIIRRLTSGQAHLLNQYRQVTTLWMGFEWHEHLPLLTQSGVPQTYLRAILNIAHLYDGYIDQVEINPQGGTCSIIFGAPVAHENNEERALLCALEVSRLLEASARIWVSTDSAYCAVVGSTDRKAYTVLHTRANPAESVTGKSAFILATDAIRNSVADEFVWEKPDEHQSPWTYRLIGLREQTATRLYEPGYHLRMIGRERELATARQCIERAQAGSGQLIGITGEAGMGKSRLSAEIIKMAMASGFSDYTGECVSHGRHTSYQVWQNIFRGFFGMNASQSLQQRTEQLEQQLAEIDSSLVQRAPLLKAVLNLPIEDNDVTRTMEGELRTDSLLSLILTCLSHRSQMKPLLLILEDCHWLDSLSQELLVFIGRNIVSLPILMLVIYRHSEAQEDPLGALSSLPYCTRMALKAFTSAESQRLIRLKFAQLFGRAEGLDSQFTARLETRAQGNPFYIEEMINLIRDLRIELSDTQRLYALELPASVRSLIISRLDQLQESEQAILRFASVVGRVFKANWLWGAYPEIGFPASVIQQLNILSDLELTLLNRPEPELEYLFKHVVTQEVTYESLPLATRETLHEQIGSFIEQNFLNYAWEYVFILAHHYGHSQDTGKQRQYFALAADAAKANYANETAIHYYRRLLPLLPEDEQGEVWLKLGEVLQVTGEWAEADEAYRNAFSQAGDNLHLVAQIKNAHGFLLGHQGMNQDALAYLNEAKSIFERLGDAGGRTQSLEYLSFVYLRESNYTQVIQVASEQLQSALERGDQRSTVEARLNMAWAYADQNDLDEALHQLEAALDTTSTFNYLKGTLSAHGDMAGILVAQGQYIQAMDHLQQAIELARDIGYTRHVAMMVGNMGIVYGEQGDYERALACNAQALKSMFEIGDRVYTANALGNIARIYVEQKRYSEAEQLYEKTISLARKLNSLDLVSEYLGYLAQFFYGQQRYAEALTLNEEAARLAEELGLEDILFNCQLLSLQLKAALGHTSPAETLRQMQRVLDGQTDESRQALFYDKIWQLVSTREDARQAAANLYHALYQTTFNAQYRLRYQALTGNTLPEPPELPPLPQFLLGSEKYLDAVIQQVLEL